MAHACNLSSWEGEAEAPGKTFQVIFSYTASSRPVWADLRPRLRGKGGKWIEFEKTKVSLDLEADMAQIKKKQTGGKQPAQTPHIEPVSSVANGKHQDCG